MGIFDSLVGVVPQIQNGSRNQRRGNNRGLNPNQMLRQLKSDPAIILRQAGFNIPASVQDPGDGSGYVQYLRETGQANDFIIGMIQNAVSGRRRR